MYCELLLRHEKAASTDEEHHMSACFLMSDINSLSSYRAELEGIFRCLSHLEYLNIMPNEVRQWCDNEQSVKSRREQLTQPTSMLNADADLVLAIHDLKA